MFSVGSSQAGVTYRWRKGGAALTDGGRIAGAMTAMLNISAVQGTDQGTYDCAVSNTCGMAMSNAAALSCKAVVTQQPVGETAIGGQTITLIANVSTGGVTTYRWRKDGANLFNGPIYAGVTTSTLTINANDPTQSGAYTLSITNPCGVTVTQPAIVEVSCAADFNKDGGIDGADVSAFFEAWESGDSSSDINFDGGVDGSDVAAFFERWEGGC